MSLELQTLQRRMAAAVMEPLIKDETLRKRRRDGTEMESEAAAFIKPNAVLTSFERLEIYKRQYWFRLYSSLEEDFPGLRAILGSNRFESLMRAYLQAYPSRSFTLRNLGSRLSDFLRERQDLIAPHIVLAQNMVHLEWAHIEAYDAASLPVPDTTFFEQVTFDTVMSLQPYLHLLELAYPVDDLLIAIRRDKDGNGISTNNAQVERKHSTVESAAELSRKRIWLAVHRHEFTVYYKRVAQEEFRMLQLLQAERPLGEVLAEAFQDSELDESAQSVLLQDAFRQWSALGWICAAQHRRCDAAICGEEEAER